jgi:hypothetical protein
MRFVRARSEKRGNLNLGLCDPESGSARKAVRIGYTRGQGYIQFPADLLSAPQKIDIVSTRMAEGFTRDPRKDHGRILAVHGA